MKTYEEWQSKHVGHGCTADPRLRNLHGEMLHPKFEPTLRHHAATVNPLAPHVPERAYQLTKLRGDHHYRWRASHTGVLFRWDPSWGWQAFDSKRGWWNCFNEFRHPAREILRSNGYCFVRVAQVIS